MQGLTYKQVGAQTTRPAALKKAMSLRKMGFLARTRQISVGKWIVEKCKK
jgi:hypothetical protein